MPELRLQRTRDVYEPGDFHRENREGQLGFKNRVVWVPVNVRGGAHWNEGTIQAAREAGAKMFVWNDVFRSTLDGRVVGAFTLD